MTSQKSPLYVSPDDAGEMIGASGRTIRRWIAEGRLEAKRFGPRLIRVKVSDVEALGSDIPTVGQP